MELQRTTPNRPTPTMPARTMLQLQQKPCKLRIPLWRVQIRYMMAMQWQRLWAQRLWRIRLRVPVVWILTKDPLREIRFHWIYLRNRLVFRVPMFPTPVELPRTRPFPSLESFWLEVMPLTTPWMGIRTTSSRSINAPSA